MIDGGHKLKAGSPKVATKKKHLCWLVWQWKTSPREALSPPSPEVLKPWLVKTMADLVLVTFSSRVAWLAARAPANDTVMVSS